MPVHKEIMGDKLEPKWVSGYESKLHNRRVRVDLYDDGGYMLSYKMLREDGTVKRTQIKLSAEAMEITAMSAIQLMREHGSVLDIRVS